MHCLNDATVHAALCCEIHSSTMHLDLCCDLCAQERVHGNAMRWWVWVEDSANEHLYHSETWTLTKKMAREGPQVRIYAVIWQAGACAAACRSHSAMGPAWDFVRACTQVASRLCEHCHKQNSHAIKQLAMDCRGQCCGRTRYCKVDVPTTS